MDVFSKSEAKERIEEYDSKVKKYREEISSHESHVINNDLRIKKLEAVNKKREAKLVGGYTSKRQEHFIENNVLRIDELLRRNQGNKDRIAYLKSEIEKLQRAIRDLQKWAKDYV